MAAAGHFAKSIASRYRAAFASSAFRSSAALSALFFFASVVVSFYAINYATERASNSVTDLVLSNIPAFDVDALFAYGTLALIAFIALTLLYAPKRIPFSLYTMGMFYFIRSAFTSLTHLKPFPTNQPNGNWNVLLSHFLFGGDLFFSAHVGVCFLMALVFWRVKPLRYIFIGWSVYMSIVVLVGHYHYSIDVASAYFITYTIYILCEKFFPRSLQLFRSAS